MLKKCLEPMGRPAGDAADVLIGREPDILADIALPGVAATLWNRPVLAEFQSWIDAVPIDQLPDLRTVVPVHLAEAAVLTACEKMALPQGPQLDRLASDVGALALMVAKVLKARQLRIRLETTTEIMCPKFHVDHVSARLLCSYRGPGTEYVTETNLDKPERYRRMTPGSVGLFRGTLWSSAEPCRLLHRSPDVPAGDARLLLVIEPAG